MIVSGGGARGRQQRQLQETERGEHLVVIVSGGGARGRQQRQLQEAERRQHDDRLQGLCAEACFRRRLCADRAWS